jgi:hypothetical protein
VAAANKRPNELHERGTEKNGSLRSPLAHVANL